MRIPRPKSRPAFVLALLVSALLASAPAARADVGETIIQRCTHGQSLAGFRPDDYKQALKELSADAEEYTDCAALIRQAQEAAAGGGGSASAPLVPLATTPAEQQALAHAARAGSAPVRVGGTLVHPGVVPASIASAFSSLPTPLLVTAVFLLVCLLAVLGGALRKRVGARRAD